MNDAERELWKRYPDGVLSDNGYFVNKVNDDGGPITFQFHFPRGTLSEFMSGLELATLILHHMAGVLDGGFFGRYPRIHAEFAAMYQILATAGPGVVDRLLPWIYVKYRQGDFDQIVLRFGETQPQQTPNKVYSLSCQP